MGKHNFRFGHATVNHDKRGLPINKRADCATGGLYKSPTAGESVKVENDFVISWDTSCMSPSGDSVDISLYNPGTTVDNGLVHAWTKVSWSRGSFTTKIDPTWYGSKANMPLQISIQDSSLPPFMSDNLAGPTFNAQFNAIAAVSASLASASANGNPTGTSGAAPTATSTLSRWEVVNNFFKHGLSKGQIAAAVIMPILAVAAFLTAYVIWNRKKETTKRKEWREKMDQRMSTISVDWKAMSAAGGHAAVRQSMALSTADRNTRTSSFFGRPSSQFVSEGGPNVEMRQARPRTTSETNRTSRVSFAADTTFSRPSVSSRPAVPPLPAAYRKSTVSYFDEQSPETSGNATPEQGAMSPTQRAGAFVLDDESIRDRLSANNSAHRDSAAPGDFDRDLDTMPAIAMMRNQSTPAVNQTNQATIAEDPNSPITPLTPALTRESAAGNHRVYSIGAYSGGTDSMIDNGSVRSYFGSAPAPAGSDPDLALRQYAATRAPAQPTASPFAGFAAGPGLAAAAGLDMSSPDAIFRAYAATRPAQPPVAATANPTGSVMRTLYGPNMASGLMRSRAGTMDTVGDNNPFRNSTAPTRHSDDVGKAN